MDQTVALDPFLERVRQAVVEPRLDIGGFDRIAGADRMKHRQSPDRRRAHVSIEILASERRAEISCEVARDERGSVRRVGAQIEGLAVGIVEGGIERAGDDERAQLRNRLADGLAVRRPRLAGRRARALDTDPTDGRARHRPRSAPGTPRRAFSSCSGPTSWGAAGKAQALPSVIDPKPEACLPSPRLMRQVTFRIVTRSTDRPPNMYGARYANSSNEWPTSRMRSLFGCEAATAGPRGDSEHAPSASAGAAAPSLCSAARRLIRAAPGRGAT